MEVIGIDRIFFKSFRHVSSSKTDNCSSMCSLVGHQCLTEDGEWQVRTRVDIPLTITVVFECQVLGGFSAEFESASEEKGRIIHPVP